MYELPAWKAVPPDEVVYHITLPALAVALRLTVPVPQRVSGVVEVIVGMILIEAITALLEVETQPLLLDST